MTANGYTSGSGASTGGGASTATGDNNAEIIKEVKASVNKIRSKAELIYESDIPAKKIERFLQDPSAEKNKKAIDDLEKKAEEKRDYYRAKEKTTYNTTKNIEVREKAKYWNMVADACYGAKKLNQYATYENAPFQTEQQR